MHIFILMDALNKFELVFGVDYFDLYCM